MNPAGTKAHGISRIIWNPILKSFANQFVQMKQHVFPLVPSKAFFSIVAVLRLLLAAPQIAKTFINNPPFALINFDFESAALNLLT